MQVASNLPLAHLDFETFSTCNILRAGGYRYAEDDSTEVLIACYAIGDQPIVTALPTTFKGTCDFGDEQWIPSYNSDNLEALYDHVVRGGRIAAHNAAFERAVWENVLVKKHGAPKTKIHQWICTAAEAAASGLPRSLARAVEALNTGHQASPSHPKYITPKDKAGDALMRLFSIPRKPKKKDPRTRYYPAERPEDFEAYVSYCRQDVDSERQLAHYLPALPVRQQRWYWLDMRMNTRGLPMARQDIENALEVLTMAEEKIKEEVNTITARLTGSQINPTQTAKILELIKALESLSDDEEDETENLRKKTIVDLLKSDRKLDPDMRRLLELRLEATKASTKKLARMMQCITKDDRVRGGFLFHGAHTSRTSGQLIQPQNFKQGFHEENDPGLAQFNGMFSVLEHRDLEALEMVWNSPIEAVSMCMRGFIKASPGKKLIPVDYASIEVRVLMWLADQQEMIDALIEGKDLYKVQAASLYNCEYAEVTKQQRHIGKQLILGCGYQLGARKFVEYVALSGTTIDLEFATNAVNSYRENNDCVKQFWYDMEECAINAVRNRATKDKPITLRNIKFYYEDWYLAIERPSGIAMRYPFPEVHTLDMNAKQKPGETKEEWQERIESDEYRPWVKDQLSFQTIVKNKIVRESTYGGKLVENITQACAADVLFTGMEAAERAGYAIVGTVHDEMIPEVNEDFGSAKELEQIICKIPSWAEGLPLKAEAFETIRYRK